MKCAPRLLPQPQQQAGSQRGGQPAPRQCRRTVAEHKVAAHERKPALTHGRPESTAAAAVTGWPTTSQCDTG
jgi:hypothetical protein